jgi:hypothetical protein
MKHIKLAILLASLAFAPLVSAQISVPAEVEGTLTSITPGTGSVELKVMDVRINVPGTGVVISTPTRDDLTLADLTGGAPFPGRSQAGFLGGTAIVLGTADEETGLITAESVFLEPAENVVLGVVTPTVTTPTPDPAGTLRVNGMLVKFLTDPRITFDKPLNDLGFEVSFASIVPGTAVAIEGYYSESEKSFYAFALEATNVPALVSTLQVSILRAQGRTDRGELDVRGAVSGVTGTGPVNVQIFRVRPNNTFGAATRIGTVAAIPGEVAGTFIYRFTTQGLTVFPERIVARVVRGGVTATSEFSVVDAR